MTDAPDPGNTPPPDQPPAAPTSKEEEYRRVLEEFCDDIESTGGIVRQSPFSSAPFADPEWTNLGATYEHACAALGRPPKVEAAGDEDEFALDEDDEDDEDDDFDSELEEDDDYDSPIYDDEDDEDDDFDSDLDDEDDDLVP